MPDELSLGSSSVVPDVFLLYLEKTELLSAHRWMLVRLFAHTQFLMPHSE